MEEYDLYLNAKSHPSASTSQGDKSADLADKEDWVFDGSAMQDFLASSVVEGVEVDGHAFRKMD